MPLPTPNTDEEKDDFIARCMANPTMTDEYPEADQRRAVCEQQWDGKAAWGVLRNDLRRGVEEGETIADLRNRVIDAMAGPAGRYRDKAADAPGKRYAAWAAKSVETDEAKRTVTAKISTLAVDRDREVLLPRGANLDEFNRNPVVMWAHNYDLPPIGKALYIDRRRNDIIAKAEFADTDFAEEIFQLYRQGILRMFSVGFLPQTGHVPTPDEIRKRPEWADAVQIWDTWELLEFSAVPIGSNRDALAIAVGKGLRLSGQVRKALDVPDDSDDDTDDAEPEDDDAVVTVRQAPRITIATPPKPVLVHIVPAGPAVRLATRREESLRRLTRLVDEVDRIKGRI